MASWWNQAIWMRYGCGSTNKYSIPNITKSGFSNSQEYAWLCLHQVVQKTWHFAHNNWGIISVNEPRFRISGAGVCQWSQKPLALRHIEIRDLPILQGDSKAWDPRKIQTSNPQNPKAFSEFHIGWGWPVLVVLRPRIPRRNLSHRMQWPRCFFVEMKEGFPVVHL